MATVSSDVLMLVSHLQLFSDLYGNNANRVDGSERKQNSNCFLEVMEVDGMYDYMMYVGE